MDKEGHGQKLPPVDELSDADLIEWAKDEIRGLDELCRSMVPGYHTFEQGELERLARLDTLERNLRDE
mgnify:CR=1 FL=1